MEPLDRDNPEVSELSELGLDKITLIMRGV